ncbi:VOC family protein [uncultured Croceitalea sp.]|uniref:VOC family protein n=1 Tax=uncultured Croceitalea sp. TaxID=1798908 RepID=UPI00374E6AE6
MKMKKGDFIKFVVILFLAFPNLMNAQKETSTAQFSDEDLFFKRTNLVISNAEKSLEIYRDILGFSIFSRKKSAPDSYSYPVFKIPKEAEISFITLNSPTQERTLALTEVKGIELPKPGVPIMTAAVIKVGNLKKVIEKIEALGLEITEPRRAKNHEFYFVEQAFIDYDGHLIVLYELENLK